MVLAQSDDIEFENILKLFVHQREGPADRTDCPGEEVLVDFLAGSLAESRKLAVQEHLAGCVACVDELVSFRKSARDDVQGEVPPALMARIKSLVSEIETPPFFDVSVRLTETTVELAGTTGHWIDRMGAEPVAMRGRSSAEGGLLEIESEMGKFNVTVNVEHVQPGACDVIVGIRDLGGQTVEGIRVSLCSGDRERASYFTREGRVIFEAVRHGQYTLPIRDDSAPVGTVRLNVI